MPIQTSLELLPDKEQTRTLRSLLRPARSRIRPFLVLFALKSHISGPQVTESGHPTVRWYQSRLIRAGVNASGTNVRRQLEVLAKAGVCDKEADTARRRRGKRGRASKPSHVCYKLNEALYPSIEQALRQDFRQTASNQTVGK